VQVNFSQCKVNIFPLICCVKNIVGFIFYAALGSLLAQNTTRPISEGTSTYNAERAVVKRVFARRLPSEKLIILTDSLLTFGGIKNDRVLSELYAKKAELLLEQKKEILDSLFFQYLEYGLVPSQADTNGSFIFRPILNHWRMASAKYPDPMYRVKPYETIFREYGFDEKTGKAELDTLIKIGYRDRLSSLILSGGIRANDKNWSVFIETSVIKSNLQPYCHLKGVQGKRYRPARFNESLILTAEINDEMLPGFSISPARINSLVVLEPIRFGIKKSWENDAWRLFLRPSVGIAFRYFSIAYSCTIYLRKSESRPGDIHYLQCRFAMPIFRTN
jgi:hypothetical protein